MHKEDLVVGVDLAEGKDQTVRTGFNQEGKLEHTNVSDADSFVDLPIVKFIMFIQGKSFAVVNLLGKQLEMALSHVLQTREQVERARGEMNRSEIENMHNMFITTFVVEKDIRNKLDILNSIKKVKGIKFSEVD